MRFVDVFSLDFFDTSILPHHLSLEHTLLDCRLENISLECKNVLYLKK